ncbi:peptidylprolyl isomerase [Thalassolituus marinus]|uniref:Peptidylprolyl isomerase n=1 Tax=Thalassolituus marinus TaxID=671053 RepID=A0ABS7ZK13_9GAMM|nr:peptidylprolyl isomerase [Thalassolituus marinus]MCA6062047.1 peptidylprolyl isomerase [Thalassolituus marinus]
MSTIPVHHILLKSPLLASDVMQELQLGADFGEMASEYSACPSASNEGFAGFHHTDRLPGELVHALYEHDEQQPYVGPVKTSLGFHILKAVKKPERPLIMDEHADAEE